MEATADLQEQITNGYARMEIDAIARMQESFDMLAANYVGNSDSDDPDTWQALGVGPDGQREEGFCSETELTAARKQCRWLARENPFAINVIETRISFVVGVGHTYKAAAIKGQPVKEEELQALQDVVDEFVEMNDWHCRQAEIRRRRDRDGEVFLRLFIDAQTATVRVRFVEPGQVSQPKDYTDPHFSFGVETDPKDVETVVAYWVDGESVPADQIQHRKENVDATVKRGIPTLWGCRTHLDRALKLLRNMSVVTAVQAAIAMIRRHQGASNGQVQAFAAAGTVQGRQNPATGQIPRFRKEMGPRIIDANANTEYEFPTIGANAANGVGVLQAELRAVGARVGMPEFMISGDASNANYSSTLVAGSSADRTFQRLQASEMEADAAIMRRVVQLKIEAKLLPDDILDRAYIAVTPPTITISNRLEEARANQIEHQEGVLSAKTWAGKSGYDWDAESANQAEEREAAVEHAQALMPPPDSGADDQMDPGAEQQGGM